MEKNYRSVKQKIGKNLLDHISFLHFQSINVKVKTRLDRRIQQILGWIDREQSATSPSKLWTIVQSDTSRVAIE